MSEIVEWVATAIGCLNDSCRNEQECKDCTACLQAARAAIEALREPTAEMKSAADVSVSGEFYPPDMTWELMIDAALK